MSKHVLRAVALAAALLPVPWAAAAPLSLDQAIELAVQRSQMTRSARAGATSAAEMARAAGQQPDPMLSVGIDNLPVTGSNRFSTSAEDMTMKRIGIAQEWVSAEKRSAREAAAQAMAGRESVMEKVAAAEARMQTALAYVEAYYAGQALALATLNEMHAHEELEAGKGRLATVAGSSGEVLALDQRRRQRRGRVRRHAPAARRGRRRPAAVDRERRPTSSPSLAWPSCRRRTSYVASHPAVVARQRDIEVARQEAAGHRGRTAGRTGPRGLVRAAHGRPDLMSFVVNIPLTLSPARAAGPRDGGQAGARRQGRGRARRRPRAPPPANTRRWPAMPAPAGAHRALPGRRACAR